MVIVSHDRYFINKLATRILKLESNGVVEYLGNYDYYLEKTKDIDNVENAPKSKTQKSKNDYQLRKEAQAKERKRLNDIKKTEEQIEKLDEEIAVINEQLQQSEVISNYEKLMELTDELEQKQSLQERLYEFWEELSQ